MEGILDFGVSRFERPPTANRIWSCDQTCQTTGYAQGGSSIVWFAFQSEPPKQQARFVPAHRACFLCSMFAAKRRVASRPIILKPPGDVAVVVRSRHSGCYRQNRSRPACASRLIEPLSFRFPLQSSRVITVLFLATENSFRFSVLMVVHVRTVGWLSRSACRSVVDEATNPKPLRLAISFTEDGPVAKGQRCVEEW